MDSKKIKLGIFCHDLSDLGGTPKCAHNQVKHLIKEYDVFFFVYRDGFRRQLLEKDGITVCVGGDNIGVKNLIKEKQIDILHLHRHGAKDETTELIEMCRPFVKKIVETNVFGIYDPVGSKYIDYHIFVSDFGYKRVKQVFPEMKGSFIKLNFDINDIYLGGEKDYTTRIIGRHSRPNPYKWHPVSYESAVLLKKKGIPFKYYVLGIIPEAQKALESAGIDLQIEQPSSDIAVVRKILSKLTIFLHGSVIGEIHPGNVLEAFCAKTPVITFDNGHADIGHIQFVQQSGAGFVAKTTEEYAGYIERLLNNPQETKELGQRGFEWVRDNFSTEKVVAEYKKVLEVILNE